MSRANILNTGTTSYLELIGNGKTYRVPPYQRDYAWTQQEWEDLWNDVVELRGDPDVCHFAAKAVIEGQANRPGAVFTQLRRCGCGRASRSGAGQPDDRLRRSASSSATRASAAAARVSAAARAAASARRSPASSS